MVIRAVRVALSLVLIWFKIKMREVCDQGARFFRVEAS